jgi:hypothetical protein
VTNTELIAKAMRGERITKTEAPASLFERINGGAEPHYCEPFGRPIVCNSDDDVIECGKCGRQWVGRCNFDDDMS